MTTSGFSMLCGAWLLCLAAGASAHDVPAAAALPNAGEVAFENSGAAAAQPDFLYGLAQLHNFEYRLAAEAFRRAQQKDPGFAMAYWGEAMTHNHPLWEQQDLDAARAVLRRFAPGASQRLAAVRTEREKAYWRAMETLYGEGDKFERDRRHAAALRALHEQYPDDVDATCFYALALMGQSHEGRHLPSYMRAAALLQEVFERRPRHPGAAHYLIHAVDDPTHAPLGLRAARAYSAIAPDAPHAQHMTSHIFIAMGMWDEVVRANETATRQMERLRAERGRGPSACGHGYIWLSYGYLQQGRPAEAQRRVDACADEAAHRAMLPAASDLLDSDSSSAGSFATMRARYLIDSGEWDGPVARLSVDVSAVPIAEFERDFVDAFMALRREGRSPAREVVDRAQRSAARVTSALDAAGRSPTHPSRVALRIHLDELEALWSWRRGERDKALARLAKAAEDERAMPYEFGPPTIRKPAFELLGELLLEAGRQGPAREAFEAALELAPGRAQSVAGLRRAGG
ncbi:MAG TPA: hypothetical protein VF169_24030 [Albitalea sp.]|uniref:hypothetical protein n=1 Tax=Piscinibacter sp. TaxID=1903157 RepID=UPI002ED36A2D